MTDPDLIPMGPGRDADAPEPDAPEQVSPEVDEPLAKLEIEITPETLEAEPDSDSDGDDVGTGASVTDLEALLFVAERPLSRAELRSLARLSSEDLDARLGDLEVQLRDRGIRLVSSDDRVMLGTSPESGQLIARYLGADTVRLSPAALETLAIIAYRQPVTRGVIERIRGVDSGHVARGLLHRRLIVEQGRAETPGRPILYGTSMEFMERFGLTSLDDLPPLEAEIAAQLAQAEEDSRAAGGDGDKAEAEGDGEDESSADDENVSPDGEPEAEAETQADDGSDDEVPAPDA
jgi:segregation and condensation protein B